MREKVANFIKYNNAFSLIVFVFFFYFGVSFAATASQEGVYSSKETVIAVDNGLILATSLDHFNFNLRITSVTEDSKSFYVVYTYQTLAIEDGAWQSKQMEKTLNISKEALGDRDLGLHVAEELSEAINYELSYLKKVQRIEIERGESQKMVAVEYSGLVGKFFDPDQMVIEGYSPVIPEPAPDAEENVELKPDEIVLSEKFEIEVETEEEEKSEKTTETGTSTPSTESSSQSGQTSATSTSPETGSGSSGSTATTTPETGAGSGGSSGSTATTTPETGSGSSGGATTTTPEAGSGSSSSSGGSTTGTPPETSPGSGSSGGTTPTSPETGSTNTSGQAPNSSGAVVNTQLVQQVVTELQNNPTTVEPPPPPPPPPPEQSAPAPTE